MWYTEKQSFQTNTEVFPTQSKRSCLLGLLTALLLLLFAPAAYAQSDYEAALDRLDRLQNLAESYVSEQSPESDPIVLTLAYTRVGEYNSDIWMMTAGVRDAAFEAYVAEQDGDCIHLQGMGSVTLPNGQSIDFSHLLASINLVYNGMPITGSWGGDCMQLALDTQGQAADADGYYALMQQTFNMDDDGTYSRFGDQDLRADLDSVVVGAQLTRSTSIAGLLREYYDGLDDYTRVYKFIALSFGATDTADTAALRETVFTTLTGDTGMQLLLYINGMWTTDGWQLSSEYEAAMRGACNVFADYLASAVNGEKVKAESGTRMMTIAAQALAETLSALGDSDAADAALSAHSGEDTASSAASSDTLAAATETIKSGFNVKIFLAILLALGGLAVLGIVVCIVMIVRQR